MDDAEVTNEEEEPVGTLAEYIEEYEAEELEADLVLGGDEGNECTYNQGYMKRQAVFACLTCTPSGDGGFCTACSLACHDNHDVIELWTRRHFRCDCGNSKYGEGICKLQANKDIQNTENVYNQNYRGLYCTCHRAYPDPEGEDLGEMLQCCICEDWFHECHLGLPPTLLVPRDEEGEPVFDELICPACVPKCSFVSKYQRYVVAPMSAPTTGIDPVENKEEVNVSGNDSQKPVPSDLTEGQREGAHANGDVRNVKEESAMCESSNGASNGAQGVCKSEQAETDVKNDDVSHEAATNGNHCVLKEDVPTATLEPGLAIFLTKSWRTELCRCPSCLSMYEEKGINFLLDSEDTLQEYEASAKRKREESRALVEGAGSDFMKNLGHVQRIELLHGLNDMTSELKSFLEPFGESGRTVTSADIHDFFQNLSQKRRRRN